MATRRLSRKPPAVKSRATKKVAKTRKKVSRKTQYSERIDSLGRRYTVDTTTGKRVPNAKPKVKAKKQTHAKKPHVSKPAPKKQRKKTLPRAKKTKREIELERQLIEAQQALKAQQELLAAEQVMNIHMEQLNRNSASDVLNWAQKRIELFESTYVPPPEESRFKSFDTIPEIKPDGLFERMARYPKVKENWNRIVTDVNREVFASVRRGKDITKELRIRHMMAMQQSSEDLRTTMLALGLEVGMTERNLFSTLFGSPEVFV